MSDPIVVETSGSTGVPKRVVLSAAAFEASTTFAIEALGGPGQWVLALPEEYIAGRNVIARNAVSGAPLVKTSGSFTAEGFVDALGQLEHDRRYASLVPTQLARLVDAALLDRSFIAPIRRLNRILLGGQSAPQGLVERAARFGWRVTRTYGSSETSGGCVWDGLPLGDTRVRLTDQIELSGSVLAEGYEGNPALTAERFVIDEDGARWFRTGDVGTLVHGILQVTGRLDDMIVSGGVNVSLAAVEAVVQGLTDDAVVVAGPDEVWGHVPVVVSTRRPSLAEIRAAVGNALGKAARPNYVLTLSEMPRLRSGKPDRVRIGKLAVRESTRIQHKARKAEREAEKEAEKARKAAQKSNRQKKKSRD